MIYNITLKSDYSEINIEIGSLNTKTELKWKWSSRKKEEKQIEAPLINIIQEPRWIFQQRRTINYLIAIRVNSAVVPKNAGITWPTKNMVLYRAYWHIIHHIQEGFPRIQTKIQLITTFESL